MYNVFISDEILYIEIRYFLKPEYRADTREKCFFCMIRIMHIIFMDP